MAEVCRHRVPTIPILLIKKKTKKLRPREIESLIPDHGASEQYGLNQSSHSSGSRAWAEKRFREALSNRNTVKATEVI